MKEEYQVTKREMDQIKKFWLEETVLREQEKELINFFIDRHRDLEKRRRRWWKKRAEKYGFDMTDKTWIITEKDRTIRQKKDEANGI